MLERRRKGPDLVADESPSPISKAIIHARLPLVPWMNRITGRLPGVVPVELKEWLLQDEVYAEQMAYRETLLRNRRASVFQCNPVATEAADELLQTLRGELPLTPGYHTNGEHMRCPDGRYVQMNSEHPLVVSARLVQEDLCLLTRRDDSHILVGAVVCFPAGWTLSEKMGRSLLALHGPIQQYDAALDRRVERMFLNIRPEHPLMRGNFLIYTNPDLHQPALESERPTVHPTKPRYVRVERQTLRRLPETGAIVFAIHTCQVRSASLSEAEHQELARRRPTLNPECAGRSTETG